MRGLRRMVGAAFAIAPVCATAVTINEVLYDPAGPDAGAEFVELYNPGRRAVELQGWRLEAGNGASPNSWRIQWTGGAGDQISPGAFFLIAGDGALSLQNGPDGVRLVSPLGVVDVVGWGNHTYPEYYETEPAADVPSGWSLARVPDGTDRDHNAEDLVGRASPTPGAANAPPRALRIGELRCVPPLLDPGCGGELRTSLENVGMLSIDLGACVWDVTPGGLGLDPAPSLSGTLDPGQSRSFAWTVAAPESAGLRVVVVSLQGEDLGVSPVSTSVRVGRGPVLISEVQYDPEGDEGEWIELFNRSGSPVDLRGWCLEDASGRATRLGGSPLDAGQWGIVAQNESGLLRCRPGLDPGLLIGREGAWPSLNNSLDRTLGYADQVLLRDSAGHPSDCVTYVPGDLDGGGISLERWIEGGRLVDPETLIPCGVAGGATPGRSGLGLSDPNGDSGWFRPRPYPFRPDQAGAERFCRLALPASEAEGRRITADVYSMAGRRVTTLTAGADADGAAVLIWDGRSGSGQPLPTGLYLIRVAQHVRSTGEMISLVRPVALWRG